MLCINFYIVKIFKYFYELIFHTHELKQLKLINNAKENNLGKEFLSAILNSMKSPIA